MLERSLSRELTWSSKAVVGRTDARICQSIELCSLSCHFPTSEFPNHGIFENFRGKTWCVVELRFDSAVQQVPVKFYAWR